MGWSLARLLPALAIAAFVTACGDKDEDGGPSLAPLVWTWVPLEGTACSDGSRTGIGIEPAPGPSPNVLVFLNGGGACWDALTCFGIGTATPGPYGAAELDRDVRTLAPSSILDRAAPGNPYRDFTFVFVPYCTGDVHAGDTVQSYPGAPRAWHHKGRVNLQRAFQFLGANLGAPSKVVVSGASAGGFGSLLAFRLAKDAWPAAKGYLVDDSGPPIDEIPDLTRLAWYASWDLGAAVIDVCGIGCATSLAPLFPALQSRYPADRFGLLSSTGDTIIRSFYGDPLTLTPMPQGTFEDGLRALAASIEDDSPPGEGHAFVITGTSHTMLGAPASFTSEGTTLFEWLRQQVEDDPAWAAKIPPP